MEGFSVKSIVATTIPSFVTRSGLFIDKHAYGNLPHALEFPYSKTLQLSRKLKFLPLIAHSSATTRSSPEPVGAVTDTAIAKDENLVFVAGSTGKVGSRTVRELLKLGFHVRAGVRSTQKADSLVQSVKQMIDSGSGSDKTQPLKKLEIVECDLEKPQQIPSALGNASIVICCIGASEKEIFDITGPCRIDYRATKNLIDAATVAKVNHFTLVSSLGTNKFGLPAAVLNLFWGVLIWKRKAEEALIASGLPYTIVRPGGMERPTDAYKETHNITLSTEDTLFGGQVSNLQVAELMAVMARNRGLSFCKVVEVIAETTAPLIPMEELLAKIPSQRPLPQSLQGLPVSAAVDEPTYSTSDVSSSTSKEKPKPPETAAKQPLSPYVVYEDLMPPSSPIPSQPVTSSTTFEVAPKKLEGNTAGNSIPSSSLSKDSSESSKHFLSPYHAYEDLKPPSSPSPSQPVASSTTPAFALKQLEANSAENSIPSDSLVAKDSNHYRSPYHAYADFKPPTSPSPDAPTAVLSSSSVLDGSTLATLSSNGAPQPVSDSSDEGNNQNTAKYTVHSPFTMYEDMKPPASPAPSKS